MKSRFTKSIQLILCLIVPIFGFGQYQESEIMDRLSGLKRNDMLFFQLDGIDIAVKSAYCNITPKELAKTFRIFKVSKKDLETNKVETAEGYWAVKKEIPNQNSRGIESIVFAPADGNLVHAFSFVYQKDSEGERVATEFVKFFLNQPPLENILASNKLDTVDFVGRDIYLGSACRWMSVNNIQCPYLGQISWTVHHSLEAARQQEDFTVKNLIETNHKGRVVSDEKIPVRFEGEDASARKLVFDLKGVTSLLAGMSGGETLTIYYVTTSIRGKHISCTMSHWNNDRLEENNLPPLINEVMSFKN